MEREATRLRKGGAPGARMDKLDRLGKVRKHKGAGDPRRGAACPREDNELDGDGVKGKGVRGQRACARTMSLMGMRRGRRACVCAITAATIVSALSSLAHRIVTSASGLNVRLRRKRGALAV